MCLILVLKAAEMNMDNAEDCGGYDIKVVVVQGSKRCTINHKDAHKVKLVFLVVESLLPFCALFFPAYDHWSSVGKAW